MSGKILAIVGWAIVISIFVIFHLIDRRIKTKGALFAEPATSTTPSMRLLALLLGIVLAIIAFKSFDIVWAILAIALIGYGLGMGSLLTKLQANDTTAADSAPKTARREKVPAPPAQPGSIRRTLSSLLRWVLLLAAIGAAIYGALWVSIYPGEGGPILTIFVIGLLVLSLVGVVRNFESIVDLIKRILD
jgi:MFS family permease